MALLKKGDKPRIGPLKPLEIHPAAKVLHYAVEVFEGMKAYYGVDGKIRLFRPELNMARLTKSSARSTLPVCNNISLNINATFTQRCLIPWFK